jgi:hypothetical protein
METPDCEHIFPFVRGLRKSDLNTREPKQNDQ